VAYLAFVAWMTLRPAPYEPEAGEFLQRLLDAFARSPVLAWITFDVVEFTANVVMFVPLGILCLVWFGARRWWTAPVAGLALSGAIELAQATLLDSRVSDVRDLIANTLGAVVGMGIVLLGDRLRSRA
jgi:glycopeptide antibiotics resistance protein